MEPFLRFYNQKYKTNWRKDQISDYKFWNILGVTREQAIYDVHDFYKTSEAINSKPIIGAIDGVNFLERNNGLVIITGRPAYQRENTINGVGKSFPGGFSKFNNNFTMDIYQNKNLWIQPTRNSRE